MKNTGITYEELIAQLFKSMAQQEGLKNINIQHDVTLKGKAGGTHQIDVYWEFEHLGINHKIIIEAKDYASKVTQEKLFAFKSVLDDIAGQPRGIYITKTGYQSGAKQYAEHHNIILYEFRQPTDNDWKGKMRNIYINFEIGIPHVERISFTIDFDWLKDFSQKNNIRLSPDYRFSAYSSNIFFYDKNDQQICSVQEKINALVQEHIKKNNRDVCTISKKFTEPTYINTLDKTIPKLKITTITFELHFQFLKDKMEIHGDDVVKFILKDVLKNDTKRIDDHLQIINSP